MGIVIKYKDYFYWYNMTHMEYLYSLAFFEPFNAGMGGIHKILSTLWSFY
jgi:hypothetical protein